MFLDCMPAGPHKKMPLGDDGSSHRSREKEYFLGVPTDDHEENGGYHPTSDGIGSPPTRAEERSSTRIAIINFFKGLFGAGVLAIPNAFTYTGETLTSRRNSGECYLGV